VVLLPDRTLEAAFDQRRRSPSGLNTTLSWETSMSIVEAPVMPEIGDSAYYRAAAPSARKLRVTVTEIFANGRIKVVLPDGTWKSLPRRYHKRVQNEHYGLVRIE
jgi:hypothetical protein